MSTFEDLRKQMIDYQLAARGLHDQSVLDALNTVPREEFVPTELVEFAYRDSPLPIAASQTISQPYIVALMTAALELKSDERVLEVGTGSGMRRLFWLKLLKRFTPLSGTKFLQTRLELDFCSLAIQIYKFYLVTALLDGQSMRLLTPL